jgi:anti-sigma factor RsiW
MHSMSAPEHPGDQLTGYVDGVLEAEELRAVGDHLAGCAQCRGEVGELRAVRELLRSAPDPVPHPALLPRMLAALGRRDRRAREPGAPEVSRSIASVFADSAGWPVNL